MRLNYKLWLEENDEKQFGDGPCDILQLVDKLGSLRQAADAIDMSYSQAWELINGLEEKLGFKLLIRQTGGSSGGGSRLTERGKLLTRTFADFREEAIEELEKLADKYFAEDFFQKLN